MAETGTAATAVSPIEGHRRGPWSQAEDDKLIALVGEHGGLNWVRISISLGTRSPKQCRERFHQNLKPSLSHEPISANEGAFIIDCVHKIGKRWAEIARQMPGRSDNAVKNWWNGNQNRSKRSEARRRNSYLSAGEHHGYHRSGEIGGALPSNALPSPTAHHHKRYQASWTDAHAALPSPPSSASPDLKGYHINYTTSPTRHPSGLPCGQLLLPPLPPQRSLPRMHPSPPTAQPSNNGVRQRDSLLTAPSSPTSRQMVADQQWKAHDQQKQVNTGRSRISVSSLLG